MDDEKVSDRVTVLRKWHKHAEKNCYNEPQTVIAFAAEIRASGFTDGYNRGVEYGLDNPVVMEKRKQFKDGYKKGQAELIEKIERQIRNLLYNLSDRVLERNDVLDVIRQVA